MVQQSKRVPKVMTSVVFDSKMQRDRIRSAAKVKRWSLSRFMLEASEKAADDVLAFEASRQQGVEAPISQ